MTAEMVAPAWMHAQITAEQYDSWSEEQCAGLVYTYLLDPAGRVYRDGEVFAGAVKAAAPFPVEIDLSTL